MTNGGGVGGRDSCGAVQWCAAKGAELRRQWGCGHDGGGAAVRGAAAGRGAADGGGGGRGAERGGGGAAGGGRVLPPEGGGPGAAGGSLWGPMEVSAGL